MLQDIYLDNLFGKSNTATIDQCTTINAIPKKVDFKNHNFGAK